MSMALTKPAEILKERRSYKFICNDIILPADLVEKMFDESWRLEITEQWGDDFCDTLKKVLKCTFKVNKSYRLLVFTKYYLAYQAKSYMTTDCQWVMLSTGCKWFAIDNPLATYCLNNR